MNAGETLTQADAARAAGVSLGQLRVWERQGRLTRLPSDHRSVTYEASRVREVAEWFARAVSEAEAARLLGVLPATVRAFASHGQLGESRVTPGGREYERAAVERLAEQRAALMSMRQVARELDVPWWVLSEWVSDGLVTTEPGPKGAKLVDPLHLLPLLDRKLCEVCGEILEPGRKTHFRCFNKTTEARNATAKRMSEWWKSDAASSFRSLQVQLSPCPAPHPENPKRTCGRRVWTTAARQKERLANATGRRQEESPAALLCCSKSCAARYRARTGFGLEYLLDDSSERAKRITAKRRRRWGGRKGSRYGMEADQTNGGRPKEWAIEAEGGPAIAESESFIALWEIAGGGRNMGKDLRKALRGVSTSGLGAALAACQANDSLSPLDALETARKETEARLEELELSLWVGYKRDQLTMVENAQRAFGNADQKYVDRVRHFIAAKQNAERLQRSGGKERSV